MVEEKFIRTSMEVFETSPVEESLIAMIAAMLLSSRPWERTRSTFVEIVSEGEEDSTDVAAVA